MTLLRPRPQTWLTLVSIASLSLTSCIEGDTHTGDSGAGDAGGVDAGTFDADAGPSDAGGTSDAGSDGGRTDAGALLPAQVLDLTRWKVTLPVDVSPSDGKADEIKQPALATYEARPWFHTTSTGDAVAFRAPLGGARTSTNTKYARTELRERQAGGTSDAAWACLTAERRLVIEQRITASSTAKPEVAAGQIHDASNDNLMVKYVGPTGANGVSDTGRIEVHFNDDTTSQTKVLDDRYRLGEWMRLDISATAGVMTVVYSNLETNKATTVTQTVDGSVVSGSCYFKAGVYVQDCVVHGDYGTNAQCDTGTPDSDKDKFGEVEIRRLELP